MVVNPDEAHYQTAGPLVFPTYAEQTTRARLGFDPASSTGAMIGGVERAGVVTPAFACTTKGTVRTTPVALTFRLDPNELGAPFLPDAVASGCPLAFSVGIARTANLKSGVKANLDVTAALVDEASGATLGTRHLTAQLAGPATNDVKNQRTQALELPSGTSSAGLKLTLTGTLSLACLTPGSGSSTYAFGIDEWQPAMLYWPGCYPEYGIFPAPGARMSLETTQDNVRHMALTY